MRRDDRGLVLPSWVVALSAVLVALALVGFAVSGDRGSDVVARTGDVPGEADAGRTGTQAGTSTSQARRQSESARPGGRRGGQRPGSGDGSTERERLRPPERRVAYVEVYNNSSITGLAAQKSAELRDSGWRVVATDNWYGEIAGSTVYYPADLAEQARLLAADLGIDRLLPAVQPMSFDRLTVVLTGSP